MYVLDIRRRFAQIQVTELQITECTSSFDNFSQSKVYTYIKERPGAYITEIVNEVGLNRGVVKYFLRVLITHNKIETYKDGNRARYFINSLDFDEKQKKIISALRSLMNNRIISEIIAGKCNTNVDLAHEIGVSRSTITWHMKRLKEIGLITEVKKGRGKIYKINPYYMDLIQKYG